MFLTANSSSCLTVLILYSCNSGLDAVVSTPTAKGLTIFWPSVVAVSCMRSSASMQKTSACLWSRGQRSLRHQMLCSMSCTSILFNPEPVLHLLCSLHSLHYLEAALPTVGKLYQAGQPQSSEVTNLQAALLRKDRRVC